MSDQLREATEKNKILEIRCGSHLYGINTPKSDEDFVGIFMPPLEYILGFQTVKEVDLNLVHKDTDGKNTTDAIDRKFYDLRKFCTLALNNNPNILEILFVDEGNIIFSNKDGRALLGLRKMFPSKLLVKGFLGYAKSQKHKMIIKSDKFLELKDGYDTLECEDDNDVMADMLISYPDIFWLKSDNKKHIWCGDICIERDVFVKKARKIIKRRLDKATSRSELILKHGYDTKFASHLIRLLHEGLEFLNTQQIIFPLQQADLILAIKAGEYTVDQVIAMSEEIEDQYPIALSRTRLPDTPDYNRIESIVMEFMRKHVNRLHRRTS